MKRMLLRGIICLWLVVISLPVTMAEEPLGAVSIDPLREYDTELRAIEGSGSDRTDALEIDDYIQTDSYFQAADDGGTRGVQNFVFRIAKDIKNFASLLAMLAILSAVLRLLFSSENQDEFKKYKDVIIWASFGIIIMQSAYAIVATMFDKPIIDVLADDFLKNILFPFIKIIQTLAGGFFIFAMLYGFFRLVTASGDEETIKKGKLSVFNAIIGFLFLQLIQPLVFHAYGKSDCTTGAIFTTECLQDPSETQLLLLLVKILNYINTFVAIITVIMIVYAGFLMLTSSGDEERIKKAKNIIKYAAVGLVVLFASYIAYRFFLYQDMVEASAYILDSTRLFA